MAEAESYTLWLELLTHVTWPTPKYTTIVLIGGLKASIEFNILSRVSSPARWLRSAAVPQWNLSGPGVLLGGAERRAGRLSAGRHRVRLTHTCTQIHARTCAHTHMHVHTHTRTGVTNTHADTCKHTHSYSLRRKDTCTCTHTHTQTHTTKHKKTHLLKHTHTPHRNSHSSCLMCVCWLIYLLVFGLAGVIIIKWWLECKCLF